MKRILGAMVLALVASMGASFLSAEGTAPVRAVCVLSPTAGNKVTGKMEFLQMKGYVLVKARLEGLTPGRHGFHIHEAGDCSAPDGSSAKGHFNPAKHQHGGPSAHERHAGDLGNIKANSKGVAEYVHKDKVIKLSGENSIVGKAVIVHADKDDYLTQPTGNAGKRVACGVIEAEEKKDDSKK